MTRKFCLTFDVPDGATVADVAKTIGYVTEHFTIGLSAEQRATRTAPNTRGVVWDGDGNKVGAFTLKTIGELHLTPKNEQPKTLRDPGLREAFTRMRHGLDTVETAMRGLADELSAMLLESDIADGDKMIAHDNLIDRIYETIAHGDESHREWLRAELNKFKHAPVEPEPEMISTVRYAGEIVELTQNCELGEAGERAIVLLLEAPHYMTLSFFNRSPGCRTERTGADYKFLRSV